MEAESRTFDSVLSLLLRLDCGFDWSVGWQASGLLFWRVRSWKSVQLLKYCNSCLLPIVCFCVVRRSFQQPSEHGVFKSHVCLSRVHNEADILRVLTSPLIFSLHKELSSQHVRWKSGHRNVPNDDDSKAPRTDTQFERCPHRRILRCISGEVGHEYVIYRDCQAQPCQCLRTLATMHFRPFGR